MIVHILLSLSFSLFDCLVCSPAPLPPCFCYCPSMAYLENKRYLNSSISYTSRLANMPKQLNDLNICDQWCVYVTLPLATLLFVMLLLNTIHALVLDTNSLSSPFPHCYASLASLHPALSPIIVHFCCKHSFFSSNDYLRVQPTLLYKFLLSHQH